MSQIKTKISTDGVVYHQIVTNTWCSFWSLQCLLIHRHRDEFYTVTSLPSRRSCKSDELATATSLSQRQVGRYDKVATYMLVTVTSSPSPQVGCHYKLVAATSWPPRQVGSHDELAAATSSSLERVGHRDIKQDLRVTDAIRSTTSSKRPYWLDMPFAHILPLIQGCSI